MMERRSLRERRSASMRRAGEGEAASARRREEGVVPSM